jgi:transcriptional regulator with XRE-family HTH domain
MTENNGFPPRTRSRQRLAGVNFSPVAPPIENGAAPGSADVGQKLRVLRVGRGLSLRALAALSGLNVNTLSLIENGKTSPSVATLQQLAFTLQAPITAFFENEPAEKSIVFQKAGQRPRGVFSRGMMEDMGAGLKLAGGQPLLVTLEPKADSGPHPIVHTGQEFVYLLEGRLCYTIEDQSYLLLPGDSLIFEAHLPHRWENAGDTPTRSMLILCPADAKDRPTDRHFNCRKG